jgi:hypothetical protein
MSVQTRVSTYRAVACVAVLVSAALHLWLWFDGVRDQDVIGELFLVNVVAGVVIAVLLVRWRHWVPPFLAAGFGASTLGAFVISSTVGLFGIETSWDSWYVWAAAISEVVAILTGLGALVQEGFTPAAAAPVTRRRP